MTTVIIISCDNPSDEVVIGGKDASGTVVGISKLRVDEGTEIISDLSELKVGEGSETVIDMSELIVDDGVVKPIM